MKENQASKRPTVRKFVGQPDWVTPFFYGKFLYVEDKPNEGIRTRIWSQPDYGIDNTFIFTPEIHEKMPDEIRNRFCIRGREDFEPSRFLRKMFPAEVASSVTGPSVIYFSETGFMRLITPAKEEYFRILGTQSIMNYLADNGIVDECWCKERQDCQDEDIKEAREDAMHQADIQCLPAEEQEELIQKLMDINRRLIGLGISPSFLRKLLEDVPPSANLVVTSQSEFSLQEADRTIKVEMKPRQRLVYRFFLDRPEGMRLKEVPSHEEELRQIYRSIHKDGNPTTENTGINNLLFNLPTLNESISRIKRTFLTHYDESVARHYYISGNRADVRKVTLDRNMVIYEEADNNKMNENNEYEQHKSHTL